MDALNNSARSRAKTSHWLPVVVKNTSRDSSRRGRVESAEFGFPEMDGRGIDEFVLDFCDQMTSLDATDWDGQFRAILRVRFPA